MSLKNKSHKAYSDFVGLMRVSLPFLALILLILIFSWSKMEELQDFFVEDIVDVRTNLANADLMNRMEKPVLEATNNDGQPFRIEADKAHQQGLSEDVDLVAPTGGLTMRDGSKMNVKGKEGHYERLGDSLKLKGDVEMESSKGFKFNTSQADFDLKSGNVKGNQKVIGQGPQGTIQAEGFELEDKGNTIIFKGRTKLVINSSEKASK